MVYQRKSWALIQDYSLLSCSVIVEPWNRDICAYCDTSFYSLNKLWWKYIMPYRFQHHRERKKAVVLVWYLQLLYRLLQCSISSRLHQFRVFWIHKHILWFIPMSCKTKHDYYCDDTFIPHHPYYNSATISPTQRLLIQFKAKNKTLSR